MPSRRVAMVYLSLAYSLFFAWVQGLSLNSYPNNGHYIRAPDDVDVSGE